MTYLWSKFKCFSPVVLIYINEKGVKKNIETKKLAPIITPRASGTFLSEFLFKSLPNKFADTKLLEKDGINFNDAKYDATAIATLINKIKSMLSYTLSLKGKYRKIIANNPKIAFKCIRKC